MEVSLVNIPIKMKINEYLLLISYFESDDKLNYCVFLILLCITYITVDYIYYKVLLILLWITYITLLYVHYS